MRKLEIVPISNIKDVLNRRDLVQENKQNILKWSSKKLLKNKAAMLLITLITIFMIGFYLINQDKNPANIVLIERKYLIQNKLGKVIWTKETQLGGPFKSNLNALWNKVRLYDIDGDGLNEVLLCQIKDKIGLYVFDDNGKELWNYEYEGSLETINEKFTGKFAPHGIIDTIHNNSKIELLVYFQHNTYYPTGIIKLDILSGKQISEVLWHSGSIGGAILDDWNGDGTKEIIAGGASNGMKRAFLFSIDHNKLSGKFPTSKNYSFLDKDLADFNHYILFPQTDYGELFFPKYNALIGAPTKWDTLLSVSIGEGRADLFDADFGYEVRFDRKLEPKHVLITDAYVVERDKFVKQGKLKLPYTDTKEFSNSIMNKIEYWDGTKFVRFLPEKED